MKLLSILALLEGVSFALATATTKCKADNCARAVTGTYASLQGTHLADCKSFQRTTVYPPTTTVYATATVYPSTFTTYITVSIILFIVLHRLRGAFLLYIRLHTHLIRPILI
jgi:hypothetical protein